MDRTIKIVPHLEQIVEPYRTMSKELKGKEQQQLSQCSFKERKTRRK
jgi:hypothetical protein